MEKNRVMQEKNRKVKIHDVRAGKVRALNECVMESLWIKPEKSDKTLEEIRVEYAIRKHRRKLMATL